MHRVCYGRVDQWISGSVDQRCMYVTPIRLDVLLNTNQISCCKGKWYVRGFDPDTVENGHIYFSCKRGGSIRILGLPQHFLWAGLISLAIG